MSLATTRARSRARAPAPRRVPRAAVVAVCLIVVASGVYIFGSSALQVYGLSREAARLEAVRRSLQEQNAILREEMKLLRTPAYIEKLAREQLGLVRPGEVAILIIRPPAPPPQPGPARLQRDNRSLLQRIGHAITRWTR